MSELNEVCERLKEIRKHLGYNQKEFGERLGLSVGGISDIERGRRQLNDRILKILCGMGISETWIKEGVGEMFAVATDTALEDALRVDDLEAPEEGDIKLIRKYMSLDVEKRRALRAMLDLE